MTAAGAARLRRRRSSSTSRTAGCLRARRSSTTDRLDVPRGRRVPARRGVPAAEGGLGVRVRGDVDRSRGDALLRSRRRADLRAPLRPRGRGPVRDACAPRRLLVALVVPGVAGAHATLAGGDARPSRVASRSSPPRSGSRSTSPSRRRPTRSSSCRGRAPRLGRVRQAARGTVIRVPVSGLVRRRGLHRALARALRRRPRRHRRLHVRGRRRRRRRRPRRSAPPG